MLAKFPKIGAIMTNEQLMESFSPIITLAALGTNLAFNAALINRILNMPMSDFKKTVSRMGYGMGFSALVLTSSHILAASHIIPGFNHATATPASMAILTGGAILWQLSMPIFSTVNR